VNARSGEAPALFLFANGFEGPLTAGISPLRNSIGLFTFGVYDAANLNETVTLASAHSIS